MESFCNTEKLDQNITNIKKTTDQENLYHQWGATDNYQETEFENTTPIRNRVVFNTKYHNNVLPQRQDQPNRSFQSENQDQQRFQRPPPNMEKDKIIKEINKMGINQRSNTQQDLHEQETNRKAVEDMRESFKEREIANKEKLEAAYRTQVHNLNQEIAKQKQANVTNNETSLAKINFQENTIYTLQQENE